MLKRLLWCYVSSLSLIFGVGENCCSISAQEKMKAIFVKICWQLNTRIWKRARSPMQMRHSKTFANSPNEQKEEETIKNRFWLWLSIVWETLELTWYPSKQFSFITFLYRTKAFNCEIEVSFSTLKNSPFLLVQSIRLHRRAMDLIPSLIPFLIPCNGCEKSAKEPRHSHHFIRQRDNIHARTTDMCVDPRGYMTPG